MTIKKSCIIAAVVTTIGMASAAEESKASGFDLTGNIQTQAYKAFYDNEKELAFNFADVGCCDCDCDHDYECPG